MTREQILSEFADDLSNEAINRLKTMFSRRDQGDRAIVVRSTGALYSDDGTILGNPHEPKPGILAGLEVHPVYPWDDAGQYTHINSEMISVYECE